jgi:hypothetical protein
MKSGKLISKVETAYNFRWICISYEFEVEVGGKTKESTMGSSFEPFAK